MVHAWLLVSGYCVYTWHRTTGGTGSAADVSADPCLLRPRVGTQVGHTLLTQMAAIVRLIPANAAMRVAFAKYDKETRADRSAAALVKCECERAWVVWIRALVCGTESSKPHQNLP